MKATLTVLIALLVLFSGFGIAYANNIESSKLNSFQTLKDHVKNIKILLLESNECENGDSICEKITTKNNLKHQNAEIFKDENDEDDDDDEDNTNENDENIQPPNSTNLTTICNDSDGGNNPFLEGIVTTNIFINGISTPYFFEDFCSNNNLLTEFYCNNETNSVNGNNHACEFGCSNGACIQPPEINGCIDYDPENNYSVSGLVSYNNGSLDNDWCRLRSYNETTGWQSDFVDTCEGVDCMVREFMCSSNGSIDYEEVSCPQGCSYGACLPVQDCFDSDDGINYFERGSIVSTSLGLYLATEDFCLGSKVAEFYCDQNANIAQIGIPCPLGYDCTLGECVQQNTYSNNCIDYDSENNYSVNGLVLSNNAPPTIDSCRLRSYDTIAGWQSNLVDTCEGTDCMIREITCSSNGNLDYEEVGCPQGCAYGACSPVQDCFDSDNGINYFEKGTIVWTPSNLYLAMDDYCVDDDITEFECVQGNSETTIFNCLNGCLDGACIN